MDLQLPTNYPKYLSISPINSTILGNETDIPIARVTFKGQADGIVTGFLIISTGEYKIEVPYKAIIHHDTLKYDNLETTFTSDSKNNTICL